MTATPDPQAVREIAREHLSDFLSKFPTPDTSPFFVGDRVLEAVGDPELWRTDYPTYIAWCDAVTAEIRAALPSWPDEQPQDAQPGRDGDGDVRAVAALERERIAAELDGIAALLEQQAEDVGGNDRTHQTILRLRADTYTNISASIRHGQTDRIAALEARDTKAAPALVCNSRLHPDFADGEDVRCELPDSHAWHRSGERTWTP